MLEGEKHVFIPVLLIVLLLMRYCWKGR